MTLMPLELRGLDEMVIESSDGDEVARRTRYCWVDENSERVSSIFNDIGSALSYLRTYPDKLDKLESKMQWNRKQLEQAEKGHESFAVRRIQDLYAAMEKLTKTGLPPARLVRLVTIAYVHDPSSAETELIEHLRSEAPEYRALQPKIELPGEN